MNTLEDIKDDYNMNKEEDGLDHEAVSKLILYHNVKEQLMGMFTPKSRDVKITTGPAGLRALDQAFKNQIDNL